MGRRIFAEKNFNAWGKVVPFADFKPFIDLPNGAKMNEAYRAAAIARGEEHLKAEIPQLLATQFMMFKRDGDRVIYEGVYFKRRTMALELAVAEHMEGKGRFLDKLIDLVWLMLEETTWVLPAHNPIQKGVNTCLPYAFTDRVDYIDLFSAVTAASLALIYHLCRDAFDGVTDLINKRVLYEIDRRIIKPFMSDTDLFHKMSWSGVRGNITNNWCPWIVSNVLTVCALTVEDTVLRTAIIQRSLPMLDSFTVGYHTDGGCDEGPAYWQAAGGALYNACIVLFDMTNGYINIYDDPLFQKMGEYAVKAVINDTRVLNFADAPSRTALDPALVYHWGMACHSSMMVDYACSRMDGTLPPFHLHYNMPYRELRFLCMEAPAPVAYTPPKKVWLDGIIVAATRERTDGKGLYLALKGGHNAESHNHNDLGNFVVFADDKPLFVDAGSGRYTRKTFGRDRYSIWTMCSDYHNCITVNGVTQSEGKQYASANEVYDEASGKLTMDLTNAYPAEAGLAAYHRSAVLENGKIVVEDQITLKAPGSVDFHYLVTKEPEAVGEGYFLLHGKKITFDPSLAYRAEKIACTEPEVDNIPANWCTDAMYRITLTTKEPVTSKVYQLVIG